MNVKRTSALVGVGVFVAVLLVVGLVSTAGAQEIGWYLLAPPILNGAVAVQRPLRVWRQLATFASLQQCHESKWHHLDWQARQKYVPQINAQGRVPGEHVVAWIWDHKLAVAQAEESLCIASNDPRLGR